MQGSFEIHRSRIYSWCAPSCIRLNKKKKKIDFEVKTYSTNMSVIWLRRNSVINRFINCHVFYCFFLLQYSHKLLNYFYSKSCWLIIPKYILSECKKQIREKQKHRNKNKSICFVIFWFSHMAFKAIRSLQVSLLRYFCRKCNYLQKLPEVTP